jgi:hypothetical protein
MSGNVSFAPTTLGMTPTACIGFAVLSRIETLHILLEHFYDSQRKREQGSARRLRRAPARREKPGAAQSAPAVPAAGSRRRIGCTPRREGSRRTPGESWVGILASPQRDGQQAVSQGPCWRQQRQDRCSCGVGHRADSVTLILRHGLSKVARTSAVVVVNEWRLPVVRLRLLCNCAYNAPRKDVNHGATGNKTNSPIRGQIDNMQVTRE